MKDGFIFLVLGCGIAAPHYVRAQEPPAASVSPAFSPKGLYPVESLTLEAIPRVTDREGEEGANPDDPETEIRRVRVRFQIPRGASPPDPDATRRLGLLYMGPGGLLVPIQRGDLDSCEGSLCIALMEENFLVRDFEQDLGRPNKWAVVPLQNPRLVERQIEINRGREKRPPGGGSIYMRVEAQFASLRLTETASPNFFNFAKNSRLATWGPQFSGLVSWRGITLWGSTESNILSTTDYYDGARNTSVSEQTLGLGMAFEMGNFRLTPGVFMLSRSFDTDNFDEAIISTALQAYGFELSAAATLPYYFNGNVGSNFRLGVGRVQTRVRQSFQGKAADIGVIQRGERGNHFHRSVLVGYELYTRARTMLWDGWVLGAGYSLSYSYVEFSGATAGSFGAPENSTSTESWRNVRFWFAREIAF